MKKINLAKTFIKVGRIIDIVMIPVYATLSIVGLGLLIGGAIGENVALAQAGSTMFIDFNVCCIQAIASLVLINIAIDSLAIANSKKEVNKGAILLIVGGALMSTFPIVSGILLLTTKEENFRK